MSSRPRLERRSSHVDELRTSAVGLNGTLVGLHSTTTHHGSTAIFGYFDFAATVDAPVSSGLYHPNLLFLRREHRRDWGPTYPVVRTLRAIQRCYVLRQG